VRPPSPAAFHLMSAGLDRHRHCQRCLPVGRDPRAGLIGGAGGRSTQGRSRAARVRAPRGVTRNGLQASWPPRCAPYSIGVRPLARPTTLDRRSPRWRSIVAPSAAEIRRRHPLATDSNAHDTNSLTGRGGANVEHASDLNRPERARTAPNYTAATCVKSVFPGQGTCRA
jgi:hypothetical protein